MVRDDLAYLATALGIDPQCDLLTWEGMGRVIDAMEARGHRLLLQRRKGNRWRACFRPCSVDPFGEGIPCAVAAAAFAALRELELEKFHDSF